MQALVTPTQHSCDKTKTPNIERRLIVGTNVGGRSQEEPRELIRVSAAENEPVVELEDAAPVSCEVPVWA